MESESEVIVVGAGAAGLMAASELSSAGKNVVLLEARDRIGGRIHPLDPDKFGYPAQGGAEFVHGKAKITRELIKEAGLTYTQVTRGTFWQYKNEELTCDERDDRFDNEVLHEKLDALTDDLPIAAFFEKFLSGERYETLKESVFQMVRGYDAADPAKISTFALRDDWLGREHAWQQGRIKEGYGALLNYLVDECRQNGAQIHFDSEVKSISAKSKTIELCCKNGQSYDADKTIITVPLPVINNIEFTPSLPSIVKAANEIGYGGAIKIIMKFKNTWWNNAQGKDLSKMNFLVANELGQTWWTQYPDKTPILTGFFAGPESEKYKSANPKELLDLGFDSLSKIFKIPNEKIIKEVINSEVINWPADPYALGAYSYPTPETSDACKVLNKPINNKIYFAGEALGGVSMAIVEGALASGVRAAKKIISS